MELKQKLKQMIIEELQIEDVTVDEIDDDAPLFGEGLGLDSLDAVELVVQLQIHFGVEIKTLEEGRPAMQSINTLTRFVSAKLSNNKRQKALP
ncbi:MAG: acyl carrier protein [Desulfamplus sp.]|nr:acyl carrier protein [Desulfamplus sp.]